MPPLTYSLSSTAAALRQLAAARHVGKVVVTESQLASTIGSAPGGSSGHGKGAPISSGMWILSGGLGALGALSARWLVGSGARHIALLGRSGLAEPGPSKAAAPSAPSHIITAATAGGQWAAAVAIYKCDAASTADASGVLAHAAQDAMCVAGVLHAGGVLCDATLAKQTLSGAHCLSAPQAGQPPFATPQSV